MAVRPAPCIQQSSTLGPVKDFIWKTGIPLAASLMGIQDVYNIGQLPRSSMFNPGRVTSQQRLNTALTQAMTRRQQMFQAGQQQLAGLPQV